MFEIADFDYLLSCL